METKTTRRFFAGKEGDVKKHRIPDRYFDADADAVVPNRFSYAAAKKGEGLLLFFRVLLIFGYVLFSAAFFGVCYRLALVPVVAVLPLLLFILIEYTWRYVSYDVYWQIEGGTMTFGRIYGRSSRRFYVPWIEARLSDGVLCGPAEYIKCADAYRECDLKWDFSSSQASPDACVLVWRDGEVYCGVRFDGTSKAARLLKTFCPGADFSGKEFRC